MKTIKLLAILTFTVVVFVIPGFSSDTKKDLQIANKTTATSGSKETKKTKSKSDFEISKTVITEIVREDTELAAQAKKLKISTVNGTVTITGKVKTEKQKQTIGTIAARVAGAEKVENKLELR